MTRSSSSRRTRGVLALACAITVTAALTAAPAGAQAPARPAPRTISVLGGAQVEPDGSLGPG